MARLVDAHPCFSCRLPDCDEDSSSCELRRARCAYRNAVKTGQPVTELMRERYNTANRELYGDAVNQKHRDAYHARKAGVPASERASATLEGAAERERA